jgi:hypothetical protein
MTAQTRVTQFIILDCIFTGIGMYTHLEYTRVCTSKCFTYDFTYFVGLDVYLLT